MLRSLRFVLVLLALGCDPAVDPIDAGVDAGDGLPDAQVCTPPDDDPFGCEDLTQDPACPASWVVGVTGRIETSAGVGVENARAQLCVRLHPDDRLICLSPPATDANGDFTIVLPIELRCLNRAAMRAIAPRMPLATTYCPVEFEVGADPIVAIADPYVLHPTTAGTVPPVGDENAQREVTLPDGLVLTLAPVDFPSHDDYLELAGARVDASATTCFAEGVVFDGAYVFQPEAEVLAGAAVSIPNTDGLAPDAEVDLYILGGLETRLIDGTMVEEGVIAQVGPATVSADGTMIVAGPDSRIPYLSWLTWKAR